MFVIPFLFRKTFFYPSTINRHDKFISTYFLVCVNKIYRITVHIFTGFKLMLFFLLYFAYMCDCVCHIITFGAFVQPIFCVTLLVGTRLIYSVLRTNQRCICTPIFQLSFNRIVKDLLFLSFVSRVFFCWLYKSNKFFNSCIQQGLFQFLDTMHLKRSENSKKLHSDKGFFYSNMNSSCMCGLRLTIIHLERKQFECKPQNHINTSKFSGWLHLLYFLLVFPNLISFSPNIVHLMNFYVHTNI